MMILFFVSVKRTTIDAVSMFSGKKDFSVLQILNTFDELTYCNNNNILYLFGKSTSEIPIDSVVIGYRI